MSTSSIDLTEHFRRAGWLPVSQEVLEKWLNGLVTKVAESNRKQEVLLPVIQEFQNLIETNNELYMGINAMLDPGLLPVVQDYKTLMGIFNKIIQEAPVYGSIGPPMYMVLRLAMNTTTGWATFLNPTLNEMFKKVFDVWAEYLLSPASRSVLNSDTSDGWFTAQALEALTKDFDNKKFEEIYECNTQLPHYGYTSYDDFFNRGFRDGIRSTEYATELGIVNGACESILYNIANNIQLTDKFWVKGEPYSLQQILGNHEYAPQFVGGTAIQGFLQVTGYHRWHSPTDGIIEQIIPLPGTYFSQSPALLGDQGDPYIKSLGYFSNLAARRVVFIRSDNPVIGLMCFVAIGMTEISSCETTVRVGQRVNKGTELGMFHFGGSTHVLIFRPETKYTPDPDYSTPGQLIRVRQGIATVTAA